MLKTLIGYFRPHRKLFAVDLICAFLVAAIDVAFPLVSRYAMYDLLPDNAFRLFFVLMLTVAAFYLLRSLCYYIMIWLGHTFGVLVENDIRSDLFAHMQTLDHTFYDNNRTGQLLSRLTGDLFEITELSHHGPEDLLISLATIIGALVFMFRIEWRLAAVVTVLIPIFLLIVMHERRRMSASSLAVKERLGSINAQVESCISGMRTSQAFTNEELDRERFRAVNRDYALARRGFYRAMASFFSSQEFFMCILPVVVIAFGGWLIMKGEMNYIDLITFTLFVTTFITPIRKMAQFAEIFTAGMAGLRRFDELMRTEPRIRNAADAVPLAVSEGRIEIDGVSFSYEDRPEGEILEDIRLDIPGGQTVAIVGHSGGGKTTLCHLIPRFYDVREGSIRIDGSDIRSVTLSSLRRQIGIVQQDVFIFADTIRENIRYGRPDASEEEVVEAARRAEIYDDILALPNGFDTYVGERGTKLSGGQKQRLSIARIFLKDPKILILDEATSALDSITEAKIQKSFEELSRGRTTLVIAHRLATIRHADRIVLIENGRIAEEGTHDELLHKDGHYADLYRTQLLTEPGADVSAG